MNTQKNENKKSTPPVAPRKDTPSNSAPNPDSHVKPSETPIDRRAERKANVETDLSNDGWKENPGHQPERELPNELYNETLPPDTRLV